MFKVNNSDHALLNWDGLVYCRQLDKTNRPVQTANLLKKETLTQVFSWEFWKEFWNTYFVEHLRAVSTYVTDSFKLVQFIASNVFLPIYCDSVIIA